MTHLFENKLLLGRDEWCALPDLHIPAIKAKIDTGAKTSALHAFNIHVLKRHHKKIIHFDIHPLQSDVSTLVSCIAPLADERHIMSSSGHIEHRYVILTTLQIASQAWEVEISLSNRDPLRYRMLLGREALVNRVLIDPTLTCHQQKITLKKARKFYL